jgi:hypothetical protein
MATKADFTEDEFATLQRGATGAGFLVSMADRSFWDTFKESGSLAKHLAQAHTESPSPLIRDIAHAHGTGFKKTASPGEVEEGTVAALTESVALLTAKSPDDVEPYRALVLDLATSVAAAADGGEAAEAAAIAKIKAALGVEG